MGKNLEKLTVKELRKLAESKGIEVTTSKKAEIIEEINNAEDTVSEEVGKQEEKAEEQENVHVRPVKKEIEVPEGFTKKTNLNKKEYGYHNGRKYLKLKNGYGMWSDTGQGFNLSDLD